MRCSSVASLFLLFVLYCVSSLLGAQPCAACVLRRPYAVLKEKGRDDPCILSPD